jgi:toxin-antitoxin system PIN domain toxin
LDVNVWLAFSVADHAHHRAAIQAWGQLRHPAFCRITQLGLLRLLCNRQVMGSLVFTPPKAWGAWEGLLGSGKVSFHDEPPGLDAKLRSLTGGAIATRDFWTDAYLAAFAMSADLRLVSFDSGFTRFSGLGCLILKPPSPAPPS